MDRVVHYDTGIKDSLSAQTSISQTERLECGVNSS